jgi:PIN domain nuclease of toxin-antitoxin system
MKYLLDTHTFIWLIGYPDKLSKTVVQLIENPDNSLYLSAASGWEIAIKCSIGKLVLPERPESFIPHQMKIIGIEELPVTLAHALGTTKLPEIHKDPFDRLLVSQAIAEKCPIMTSDSLIARYDVQTIW